MATLNSIRNVVGNYGSHSPVSPTITFNSNTSNIINGLSATELAKLSVGDVLIVTDGQTSYTNGGILTIEAITFSGVGAGNIQVNIAAAATETGLTATIQGWDDDRIASVGGNTSSSTFTDIITREWDAITINAGNSKNLVNYVTVGDPTECQVFFSLDSVTTTGGVASTGIFNLVLTDGTDSTVLASLRAGDVFYSSQMSMVGYDLGDTATFNGNLALVNTTSSNLKPSFRLVVASKA